MEYSQLSPEEERIGKAIVDATFKVHIKLGSGLLEKVYDVCMAHELVKAGFNVKRQTDIPFVYDGIIFNAGLRLDLIVNDLVIAKLKTIEIVNPVWEAQIISHLKLTNLNLGY